MLILLTLISVIGISIGTYTFFHRAANEQVYVYRCGTIDYKPASLTEFCANAGAGVAQIEWERWAAGGATGVGQYGINLCDPSCASGKWKYADVKVALSKTVREEGKKVLSRIDIVTVDGKNLPERKSPKLGWDLNLAR